MSNRSFLQPIRKTETRISLVFLGVGLGVEALVILLHIFIKFLQVEKIIPPGVESATLYQGNAIIGFLGTLLLVYGFLRLIRALHVSRMATAWGYAATVCIICFKLLDISHTFNSFLLREMLGLRFELDLLLMNLLLISCVAMVLVAIVYALFDLHKAEGVLEERNRVLSLEIQKRQLLATAIDHAVESIVITDASGKIQYVNPAFELITGYSMQEALGQHPGILLNSGHQEKAFYQELWDTVSAGKVWRGHFLHKRKDGTLFNEHATISPIQDNNGVITHYVSVKRDVTHEKELERQLQQSQKLEAVGTLAGGIAHDLNNVLSIIIGHSEISMKQLAPDHPVRRSLEVIMRTAHRSSQLIKHLLIFSRQGVAEARPLEPAPLVREQMKIIRSYLPANITITDEIEKDIGYILSEPIEIQQIIFNLCTNANHAMQPGGGTLTITMNKVSVELRRSVNTGILEAGDYVRLRVHDTGCGMDAATLKRLFEPFFTTKDPGMGTGLGLSMVHGSVTRSGGAIHVTSAPERGSLFELYWPHLGYECVEAAPVLDAGDGDGAVVLLVDDMADFNELTTIRLSDYGFEVVAFLDGTEALNFVQENHQRIDVAVVDYMMPTMNGSDLARRLHRIKPDLPVVLLSGYSCNVVEENAAEYGFCAVLSKPVETALLINALLNCCPKQCAQ